MSDLGIQIPGHLIPIHIGKVVDDVPGCPLFGIERDHSLVEPGEAPRILRQTAGANVLARSLGTCTVTSVRTVFGVDPFLEFSLLRPTGSCLS